MDAPWYVGLHAVMTSGLAYAALEPEAPPSRNLMCLEDSGAEVILSDAGSVQKAEELARGKRRIVLIENAQTHEAESPPAELTPDSAAAYVFTSGSTGRPKGVVRSQRSLAHAMYCFAGMQKYGPHDVMLYPGSPGHIGSLNDALTCMTTGFRSIPFDIARMDLRKVCDAMVEHRVSVMPMPPSLLRLLLPLMAKVRSDLVVRVVLASGEPLLRSDVELFYRSLGDLAVLGQNYGSTETGPMAAGAYRPQDAQGEGPLALRKFHDGCTLDVVDDMGNVVPPGQSGQIRVRSSYLADGYINAPPDQAANFGRDDHGRYFLIGDRGYRSANGELFIAGRGDRQIKLHGRRLELGDVESAIMAHPQWPEAVVVRARGRSGSPMLVAVMRPAPGLKADVIALRTDLASRLPPAAIPGRFLTIEKMPRTTTGKLDLMAVAKLAEDHASVASLGQGGPPQGLIENWIADAWQYILRIERPGREDRFQDLGGDSLAAIDLGLSLEKQFGVALPLDRIATRQTVAELAAEIGSGPRTRRESVVTLRKDGSGPVCVMFPGQGGHAWVFAALSRAMSGPCDMLAISLVDFVEADGKDLRKAVRAHVVESVRNAKGRPVVVGGYSFGGIVAADTAEWLLKSGVSVAHILLLDPSPLDSTLPRNSLRGLTKSVKRIIRRALRNPWALDRTTAVTQIEREMANVTRELRRRYLDGSVRLPDVKTSWIASSQMALKYAGVTQVFGRAAKSIDRLDLPCGHLELIRPPGVSQTAAWIDDCLAQLY